MAGHMLNFKPLLYLSLFLINLQVLGQEQVKLNTTPEKFLDKMIHKPAFTENAKGENFCWHAKVEMHLFIDNYELTKNTAWLDAGVHYYDFLIGKMDTDPDGYKGWIGPYIYNKKYWQDALVGDAILLNGILDFAILVAETKPLQAKYKSKAQTYVALAEKNFAQKYDNRGLWKPDGPFGAYVSFTKYLQPGNLTAWITVPELSAPPLSHPFNKQMDAGQVFLQLYRFTKNKNYRDRAEQIFFTMKNHFQYADKHYYWNYWDPLTAYDIDLKKKDTRHWVNAHPFRSGYTAREVEQIIDAYHHGIVFTEQDIQRIINTNLQLMWNKNKENPEFINSNGFGPLDDTTGLASFRRGYGSSYVAKNKGELWTALLYFDQTVRDLYEVRFKGNQTSDSYLRYQKNIKVNPPSFKRKYVSGPVKVPKVNFTESKDLYLATVLPHQVKKGETTTIICKSRNAGNLQVDLYSATGQKITNLYTGPLRKNDSHIFTWDGLHPIQKTVLKGNYKIRWTINQGYREFPVTLI